MNHTTIVAPTDDRALLEGAAKAAGIAMLAWNDGDEPYSRGAGVIYGDNWVWNPLTDDGDALRLAVKLKIPLQFPDWQSAARTWGGKMDTEPYDEDPADHAGDLATAVRRAITRAAASMAQGREDSSSE